MKLRIGQGLDVHKFVSGRRLILGGVEIPSELGLLGHSDADVLLHALIDALLGAAGKGDIGTLFPDTDLKWKDASSLLLLNKAWSEVSSDGWEVVNLDLSLLLEAPKLAPYLSQMKKNIAKALGIEVTQCGIKVTTTETLGFVGRHEGVVASAVVLLQGR